MNICKGLNNNARRIHKIVSLKGFWEEKRETGTLLMLIVSELSEALEADRNNKFADIDKYTKKVNKYSPAEFPSIFKTQFEKNIKDTFQDEIQTL